MQNIYAHQATSISELKKNPTQIITEAEGEPIAILNHNITTAYLIPAKTYEKMLEVLDDVYLSNLVGKRLKDKKINVKVKINEL